MRVRLPIGPLQKNYLTHYRSEKEIWILRIDISIIVCESSSWGLSYWLDKAPSFMHFSQKTLESTSGMKLKKQVQEWQIVFLGHKHKSWTISKYPFGLTRECYVPPLREEHGSS